MVETVQGAIDLFMNDVEYFTLIDMCMHPPWFSRSIAVVASYQILLRIPHEKRAAELLNWSEFTDARFPGWREHTIARLENVFSPCKLFFFILVGRNDETIQKSFRSGSGDCHIVLPRSMIEEEEEEEEDEVEPLPDEEMGQDVVNNNALVDEIMNSSDGTLEELSLLARNGMIFSQDASSSDEDDDLYILTSSHGANNAASLADATGLLNTGWASHPCVDNLDDSIEDGMGYGATMSLVHSEEQSALELVNKKVIETDQSKSKQKETDKASNQDLLIAYGDFDEGSDYEELWNEQNVTSMADLEDLIELDSMLSRGDVGNVLKYFGTSDAEKAAKLSCGDDQNPDWGGMSNFGSSSTGRPNVFEPGLKDPPSLLDLCLDKIIAEKVCIRGLAAYGVDLVMDKLESVVNFETLNLEDWPKSILYQIVMRTDPYLLIDIPCENRGVDSLPWDDFCKARFGADYMNPFNEQLVMAKILTPCRMFFLLLQQQLIKKT
uniref:Uncharacterized protein n=1 Tax=Mucochytrium quahogii TaxID=96639 RepID=A0A7S2RB29_9STRA